MKKPYSKYMDDRIVKILEKGIKAGEVQETIAMVDALLLHYTENGLDIDGDDEDSDDSVPISYGNEPKKQDSNEFRDLPLTEYLDSQDLIKFIGFAQNRDYRNFVSMLDHIIYEQRQQEADYQYEEYGRARDH